MGGIWTAVQRRLRPLALGCAISSAALLLPAWFAGRLEQATGLLVLPVVGAFVAAVVFAGRAR